VHHCAVKRASRNTPPVSRTAPSTCDRGSITGKPLACAAA
jgi:hypothetical protein